jgi:hypothetical protein
MLQPTTVFDLGHAAGLRVPQGPPGFTSLGINVKRSHAWTTPSPLSHLLVANVDRIVLPVLRTRWYIDQFDIPTLRREQLKYISPLIREKA